MQAMNSIRWAPQKSYALPAFFPQPAIPSAVQNVDTPSCHAMRALLLLATVCLTVQAACDLTATPCDAFNANQTIFRGTVLKGGLRRDLGTEQLPQGTVKLFMEVTQRYRNLPPEIHHLWVLADTAQLPFADFYNGEQYVIFGDFVETPYPHVITGCHHAFVFRDRPDLHYALEAAASGDRVLAGRVLASDPGSQHALHGVKLFAAGPSDTRSATLDAQGDFLITGLLPGDHHLYIAGEDDLPDSPWNTGPRSPEKDPVVPVRGCAYQTMTVVPNARISGTVRLVDGTPAPNTLVSIFAPRGPNESRVDRTTVTDAHGQFSMRQLPPGPISVRVASDPRSNQLPDPRSYHGDGPDGGLSRDIVADLQVPREGVDLTVPPLRPAARIHVRVVDADHRLVPMSTATLTSKWHTEFSRTGEFDFWDITPLWVVIYAEHTDYATEPCHNGRLCQVSETTRQGRSEPVYVTGPEASVIVVLNESRFRKYDQHRLVRLPHEDY